LTLCFEVVSARSPQAVIAISFAKFFGPAPNRHFSRSFGAAALDCRAHIHCSGRKVFFSWPGIFDFLRISELHSAAENKGKARGGGEFTGKFRQKCAGVQERKLDFSSPERGVWNHPEEFSRGGAETRRRRR
jgi:hypothetical protein